MTHVDAAAFFERTYFQGVHTIEEADYIVDTFRADAYQKIYEGEEKIHSIEVDGIEVAAIYITPGFRERITSGRE